MARKGICAICGKGRPLTEEHVPPSGGLNVPGVVMHTVQDWLARDASGAMPNGVPQPEGTIARTLCKQCNEKTGEWYVPHLNKFVVTGVRLMADMPPSRVADENPEPVVAGVRLPAVQCLALLKQIVVMILATSGPDFGAAHPTLREFVLNPERTGLPDRYRYFVSFNRGPYMRVTGEQVAIDVGTGAVTRVCEVAYFPFAYLMTIDAEPEFSLGEITSFKDVPFGEPRDTELMMLVGFAHTPLPGDYRSSAAIEADRRRNRAAVESGESRKLTPTRSAPRSTP